MVTYKSAYEEAVAVLRENGTENAEFDCACLFEKAFGKAHRTFKLSESYGESACEKKYKAFLADVSRRKNGEPLQYILGEWEFYGLPFKVGKGVLIPRQDTEALVEIAALKMKDKKNIEIIDLCAGSGCVGIALEKKLDVKKLVFVEKSKEAKAFLEENVKLNGSAAEIILGDVLSEKTAENAPQADLITCNPPYLTAEDMKNLQREVTFEPETALFGGTDGLDFYREITRLWKKKLKYGGVLAFEIGMGMEDEVSRIMIQHGFKNVRYRPDLCGVNRVVYGENITLETD